MTLTIDAIYANGVLRPLIPLHLLENQRVTLQVVLSGLTQHQPTLEEVSFQGIWLTALTETVEETIAAIRVQTQAKIEQLAVVEMPPPESITLKGLWSHVDSNELEQALAEAREQTNRRLQGLLEEI